MLNRLSHPGAPQDKSNMIADLKELSKEHMTIIGQYVQYYRHVQCSEKNRDEHIINSVRVREAFRKNGLVSVVSQDETE